MKGNQHPMKNSLRKKVSVALITAFASLSLASCAFSSTDSSSMSCVYNGGPLDSKSYRGYVEDGGGRKSQGFGSVIYDVPITVRQYRVALDPTRGDTKTPDSVKVKVKGIDLQFEPTVNFTLSTIKDAKGKPAACTFIEKQLRALGATDFNDPDGDWVNKFLNERFRPILDNVAIRELQKYDPTDLVFNLDGDGDGIGERDEVAKAIGIALDPQLQASFGGNFFCSPAYLPFQPEEKCGVATIVLPAPVITNDADATLLAAPQRAKTEANNAIAVAQENARKAKEIATQKQVEADSAEALASAQEEIAKQDQRVKAAQAANDYAWCQRLVDLGQRCDLVLAAQNSDYPQVVTGGDVAVAITPGGSETPSTTTPGTVPATTVAP
jgi:hypothetical protein